MSDLVSFATARRQSRATLHGTWLDGATISLYSAPRPTDADTAPGAAVLLCIAQLADPAGSATAGSWTADPLPDSALGLDTGDAVWARARDSAGAIIWDCGVGETDSGEGVELAAVAIVEGGLVIFTLVGIVEG